MTQKTRRFLRLKQVIEIVGLKRTAIYEKIKRNEFPKPHVIGIRAVAWLSDEIEAWVDSRIKVTSTIGRHVE